jgi:hypothetical protein
MTLRPLVLLLPVILSITGFSQAAVTLTLKADAADALIVGEAPTTVTVKIKGDAGYYELKQTFVNRYGEEKAGETIPVSLTSAEFKQQTTVPVEFFGPSLYKAVLVKAGTSDVVAKSEQYLIKPVPVPKLDAAARMTSPIGINTHNKAHWKTMAAFGIHWARDYSWGWLGHGAKAPMADNGVDFKPIAQAAEDAGISVLPILQQAFREDKVYFLSDTDVVKKGYDKMSTVFPEYKYWELDNEADLAHPNLKSPDYKRWLDSYLVYIKAAHEGLKDAGDAKVVLNGEAGIYPERAQYLIDKVGDSFSVINYHFYTGTFAPEIAENDINTGSENRPQTVPFMDLWRSINQVAKNGNKQAWLTEIAWSGEGGPEVGYRLQSAYLGRIYMLASWTGTDKTFWFWDRNMRGQGRFSGTGLIDDESGALPAGAAMAAVSKFISQSTYFGNVDIGADRWCILYKRPEGGWTVGAWAVSKEYDLPEPLAQAKEAFDMYGNPLKNRRLTAEPAYFYLADLPAGWKAQASVHWTSSATLNLYQGGAMPVEIAADSKVKVTWQGLPQGAEGTAFAPGSKGQGAQIKVAPTVPLGFYKLSALAEGEGWKKEFPLTLVVRPAVDVQVVPYTAGQTSKLELTSLIPTDLKATLKAAAGTAPAESLALTAGKSTPGKYEAPTTPTGPVELTVTLDNGAVQKYWIRPRELTVPQGKNIVLDGDLKDWPTTGGKLEAESLHLVGPRIDFRPVMRLAWAPEGLYVAAELPVGENFTAPPVADAFWEWTSVEMHVNAADLKTSSQTVRTHQFWLSPFKDTPTSSIRAYAGEWNKTLPDGKKEIVKDDQRIKSGTKYVGGNLIMECLIPVEALGAAPAAGQIWAYKIGSKITQAHSPRTVSSWPDAEGEGWKSWGELNFQE